MENTMKNYEDVDSWKTIMFLYNSALKEVGTKLEILNDEFQHVHKYNPIEHIKTRIKTPESIVKKLKEIRLSKGLPQDAVASAAEVNTSHISNIENNRVKVSLPTLIYICNALGVTVDYVLSGEYTGDYSSIDREIMKEIQSLSDEEKERVLRVVRALK